MSEGSGRRGTPPKDFREAPGSAERRPAGEIQEIYEFGPFRLEPAERKLVRGNEVVALTPKAFDTLHLLVRNSGHLVEKDELIRMLWPSSFVEEGNLTTNIFLLRRALGPGSEYIETVSKKGYRFVGAVRRLPTAGLVRPDKPREGESESAAEVSGAQRPPASLEPAHGPTSTAVTRPAAPPAGEPVFAPRWGKRVLITAIVLVALGASAYLFIGKAWISKHQALPSTPRMGPVSVAPAAFAPPSHSIAVLPFVNISGDKEQDYFADGLTEELVNSLSRINELAVAARTSSFSFQGEHPDIATVAHKLNVGAVLEGSVRRSANTVRITTHLVNGVTGFHVWSKTYDRNLSDVLKLQTEIANAVASALRVTLLGDAAAKVEVGGTRNPAAFDAYLKGSQAFHIYHDAKGLQAAIAAYTEAIRLDPNYALALVGRSRAFDELASWWVSIADSIKPFAKAQSDARKAVALAPDLGEAHLVLANSLAEQLEFTRASDEYERAVALAPGDALVLQDYGLFAVLMGRTEQGLLASRRAILLDPLNRIAHLTLMDALVNARQPEQALAALHGALALGSPFFPGQWVPDYMLGNYEHARATCESTPQDSDARECLAIIYDKLGRHADAKSELEKYKVQSPDEWIAYAQVYAQWGHTEEALSSLEAALPIRHVALMYLKTWPLFDPLRNEPRFQAIERELKFPD